MKVTGVTTITSWAVFVVFVHGELMVRCGRVCW